ncbi:glycosyltransferase family 2 protein [Mucilaginibacter gotjawali]|uniref:Glycosyltransferase involved in cell wall biosynthesis n=1 Tax=Mucilaginibacter gotjawali TaxID=1550579 RepID=A0A839SHY8_9SPHI|nr:glycosyltransferase family 2 protein [Mucilaginibacter gotjawali]MBB3057088.1 glycosyltransferase involved in cell wall biosynthesis [Mucilaginibacter gotjawali]
MPDISFFIPAYNCSLTIAESVDSIMATNFTDGDELIIVNDCSTDNTTEVLKKLRQKYPVITVIEHLRNKGGAAARNTAVENAKNELLFCLDSDNVLAPSSIPPLKKYLMEHNADVASFQFQHSFADDKFNPVYIWTLPAGDFNPDDYLVGKNTPGQHGNYLFTRQSWLNAKGYAEGTGALDTWTFGLRQAITGAKMVVLKDTFYYHRLDYANSYWMRDAEANLWSVSVKAAYALLPFFDRIDEQFLNYMLGKGKYIWFYQLKNRPLKLVSEGSKKQFYVNLNKKINAAIYPKPSFLSRAVNKIKRVLKLTK